ncbi:MAG TPA: universal stress protein [Candidatus Binatia bacterium]
MRQLKTIVVGHDLKSGGETALKSAVVLAARCDAALRLVHVVEPQHHLYQMISHPMASKNNLEQFVQQAGRKLREIVASWELAHLRVEYEVHMGKPFVEIILASRACRADLIVVGGPADKHSHFLGSNPEHVMREASVPVLVARKPLDAEAKCFLVPTDFSAAAQKAAKEAVALARSFGGRIFFLHVLDLTPLLFAYGYEGDSFTSLQVPLPSPEGIAAEWDSFLSALPLCDIAWENRTEEGPVAKTISQQAEAIRADAIVMGAHGRSALKHMLLGSVAEAVAHAAPCPVLTVKPEAVEFKLPSAFELGLVDGSYEGSFDRQGARDRG